jgi:hypothetical protein
MSLAYIYVVYIRGSHLVHAALDPQMSPVRRHRVIVRKANCKAVGWFSGTSEAHTGGQKMTIKRVMRLRHFSMLVSIMAFPSP